MKFVAQDLKRSEAGWKEFHQKSNPRELFDVNAEWPQIWECAGYCVTMYYASDKWYPDDETVNYYHDHGKSIRVYHPLGVIRSGDYRDFKSAKPPVRKWPESGFVLGECLGWDLREKKSASQVYRFVPDRGTILCSFPNRRVLFAFGEVEGVVALFAGPGMIVKDVGIVG
jgi:hypothetical protein